MTTTPAKGLTDTPGYAPATTTTPTTAERAEAHAKVFQFGPKVSDTWVAEEIGRIARTLATGTTSYRVAILAEWSGFLAQRATQVTGLVTAAADTHASRYLSAPTAWLAEQVALSATIAALDPSPYNVSLLRAFTRVLIIKAESA